jgi:hypothetical protein
MPGSFKPAIICWQAKVKVKTIKASKLKPAKDSYIIKLAHFPFEGLSLMKMRNSTRKRNR